MDMGSDWLPPPHGAYNAQVADQAQACYRPATGAPLQYIVYLVQGTLIVACNALLSAVVSRYDAGLRRENAVLAGVLAATAAAQCAAGVAIVANGVHRLRVFANGLHACTVPPGRCLLYTPAGLLLFALPFASIMALSLSAELLYRMTCHPRCYVDRRRAPLGNALLSLLLAVAFAAWACHGRRGGGGQPGAMSRLTCGTGDVLRPAAAAHLFFMCVWVPAAASVAVYAYLPARLCWHLLCRRGRSDDGDSGRAQSEGAAADAAASESAGARVSASLGLAALVLYVAPALAAHTLAADHSGGDGGSGTGGRQRYHLAAVCLSTVANVYPMVAAALCCAWRPESRAALATVLAGTGDSAPAPPAAAAPASVHRHQYTY